MTRSARRVLIDTTVLGVFVALLVAGLEYGGLLDAPERFFYDVRARYCQHFSPPPTDKLVHIDIDDKSLETIGYWPWPRSKMAEIIDEIGLAGTKALALDIIFPEAQPPGYEVVQQAGRGGPATQPAGAAGARLVTARLIDHDAALAEALRKFGKAIVPVSFNLNVQGVRSPLYARMVTELTGDMELEAEELARRLAAQGMKEAGLEAQVSARFLSARREAMYERIAVEVKGGDLSLAELRRRILPKLDPMVSGSPALRVLEAQLARYMAIRSIHRYARPVPTDLPPLISTREEQPTVRILSEASSAGGFVDYLPLADGIVRNVPLWVNHRDAALPQMGLSLACAMLDVDPKDVRLTSDSVIIPRARGDIVIPVHEQETPRGRFGMFFDIPWFGSGDWKTMYDHPQHRQAKQHMPVVFIWEACEIRHRMARNNETAAAAIGHLARALKEKPLLEKVNSYRVADASDPVAYKALAEAVFKEMENQLWLPYFDEIKEKDVAKELKSVEDRDNWTSYRALREVMRQNPLLAKSLETRREELKKQLDKKAALIGYIAVGAIADFVPTSLHPRCPGVVVHGVVFNSIMTNNFWRTTAPWVTAAITLVAGLLTTLIVSRLSPWKAAAAAAALAIVWLLFNGLLLFDLQNVLVGVAGPLLGVGAVWAGGTLARFILEASERARAEKLFRNYVDPALVDYVLGDEDARVDGQLKELTVVFTDLEGFTTVSEQLRERSVPLLNEYMGLMVPIVRKHGGYLNKLLGDGIMYFFNAPRQDPTHAVDAVASALEMQEVMTRFSESITKSGLPALRMRAGVSSGHMVVGNCGPSDGTFSDFTVLGDMVNLGSRLEGANKAFGTRVMVNQRTWELANDRVLFRPVGKIRVKGKSEGVMTFEAISLIEKAADRQKKMAELTSEMVTEFMNGQFERCLGAIERLEEFFGANKLTKLYRSLCEQYRQTMPDSFDGQIVLTEK